MGSEARARLAFVALLSLTLLAFAQVFGTGGDYRGPALLGILLGTGATMLLRRLGLRPLITTGISAALLVWYLSLIFESGKTAYGLPSPTALAGLWRSVSSALSFSRVDYAPVPVRPGYVILVVIGMWMMATLGEVATFRWHRPLIATIGPLFLFAFVATVGTQIGVAWLVVMFLAALFAYWGLESAHRLRHWGRWIQPWESSAEEPPASVAGAIGRRMGLTCLAAAVIAPAFVPSFGSGLAWRTGEGSFGGLTAGRAEVDPLVQLAPQLIEQSDRRMFIGESDVPIYWRLLSLANFDGNKWTAVGAPTEKLVNNLQVPSILPRLYVGADLIQHVVIDGLGGGYLPAAAHPTDVQLFSRDVSADNLRANPISAEIYLEGGLQPGVEYQVGSWIPVPTYKRLLRAEPGDPGDPIYVDKRFLSEEVQDLARDWTAAADTPFEKLLAIQNNLRGFEYSVNVEPSATNDYLHEFLTVTRKGFCQQFATAFALLARFLDFPTRVSVGFLPGETTPDDPTRYVVRGTDAHAWPEVYFDGFGWVAFEPTPRSDGSAVPPRYTTRAVRLPGGQVGGFAPSGPNQDLRGNLTGAGDPSLDDPNFLGGLGGGEVSGRTRDLFNTFRGSGPSEPAWQRAFERILVALASLLVLFLVSVPILKLWRVRRRYLRARDSDAAAAAAFADFCDQAGDMGTPRARVESAQSYARRIAQTYKLPSRTASKLAGIYEAAEYAPLPVTDGEAREARDLARDLRARLWRSAPLWRKLGRLFSPRGLVPGLAGRV